MVDVKAWIADLKRKVKKPEEETINYPSAMARLEREGFKQVIKTDVLTARLNEVREQLWLALQVVHSPSFSEEEKGLAVDKAFNLTTTVATAWLRGMDNPTLHQILLSLDSNYREWRQMPAFFDQIVEECIAVIDKAFCNIDVEPLTPILIWTGGYGLSPKNPNPYRLGERTGNE
jgi:hypothetical protein